MKKKRREGRKGVLITSSMLLSLSGALGEMEERRGERNDQT